MAESKFFIFPDGDGKRAPARHEFVALLLAFSQQDFAARDRLFAEIDFLKTAQSGETLLMVAAELSERACVEEILPFFDATARDGKGCTPLIRAVKGQRLDTAKALLERSNASEQDLDGWNALMHAIAASDREFGLDCVRLLLPQTDLAAIAEGGDNAFLLAARIGTRDILDALLPHFDARERRHASDDNLTPLMIAAAEGNAWGVEALLPLSDPNAQDFDGWNALMFSLGDTPEEFECGRMLIPVTYLSARTLRGKDIFDLGKEGDLEQVVGRLVAEREQMELKVAASAASLADDAAPRAAKRAATRL